MPNDSLLSLESATRLIDALSSTRPPAEVFNQLARQAAALLDRVYDDPPTTEQAYPWAEFYYQWTRLAELGASYFPADPDHLAFAKDRYLKAVAHARKVRDSKLTFYEAEFAAFQKRWPGR